MKQTLFSASRLGSLACLLVLHLCTVTASRAAILAGPITNTANGHIYYLLSPTNWPSAEAEAVSLHGHLATINDEEENTWVFNRFATNGGVARNLWLGLNDAAQEGNWVWVSGEAAAYRKWAPGEPNNGGGFFPDEDQALMRGPALSSPGSWNDAPGDQVHTPVVELGITAPPANTGAYDVAWGFSTNSNPNGAWSYGSSVTLGAPITLFSERGNWAGLNYWRAPILLGVPGVYHNPSNLSVTNSTGTAILGPGQLSFYPGPNGEFCIIRFTAPTNGLYQVSGAFTGVDPHGTITDVHVLVNGVTFNGSVNGYGAGSGPTFNLIVDLNTGDPVDFAVGRNINSQFSFVSTGLSVQISTSNAPPAGVPPTITSQPQSRTVNAGTNVTFFVTATGTTPLSYQWRRNTTNLAGTTAASLTLSNVQPANAGIYSVRVTNAFGAVTSSNAVLTVLSPSTNCVSAPTGLVSWWRAEGNANDAAGTNNGTAPFGMSYAAGEVGGAFNFNGTNASVSVPAAASLDVGQGSGFSVECWINPAQIAAAQPLVEWFQSPGPPFGVHFWISEAGSGTGPGCLYVNIPDRLGGEHKFSSAKGIVGTNSWQHVALTYERDSGLTKMFYNGTVVASQTLGFYTPQTSYGLYLGHRPPSMYPYQEAFFKGGMDEFAVYNRALSTNEIQAIFNAGSAGRCPPPTGIPPAITSQPQSRTVSAGTNVTFFVTATGTAPLSYQWRRDGTNLAGTTAASLTLSNVQPANAGIYSVRVTNAFGAVTSSNAVLTVLSPSTNCVSAPTGLVSWWSGNGNANDIAGTNNGIFVSPSFSTGKVSQAFSFIGSSNYVRVPASSTLNVGTGNGLTIEAWINPADLSQHPIVEWAPGGIYGAMLWISVQSPGSLYADLFDPSGHDHLIQSAAGVITTNVFQHVAVTYDKASGLARLFVNGALIKESSLGSLTLGTSADLYIGYRPAGSPFGPIPFKGLIDEVSIYNRALGSNEIAAIYAAGSAGKCPPPAGIPPTITSQPQSQTVNSGTNVTFFVTATGTAPLSYQWRRNETNLPGATGTSLTLSNVQPANAGTYSVRVSNAFGSVTSSNAVLTVLPPASPILAGPITNPANGHIYFLIGSNSWTGAEAQAVNLGGHLVTINDAIENAWVLSTFGSFGGLARPLWIGLNDAALEGAFVWVSGEAAAYRNWMPGEPNNGGGFVPDEDYVGMRGPGLSFSNAWNDTLNTDLYVGVVEIGQTVSPTNCVSAPTGLVSWWRAESNTVDSVDSNHGTLKGNATFGTGRVGQGFVFDGSGDAVSLGSATNLQLQTFTIEAWIKRASSSVSSGSSPIFANLFAYGVGGYGLGLQSNGRLYLSKIEISDVGITNAVTDTNWHHVAVTKAGSSVLFYVDGLAYTAPAYDPTFAFSTAVAIGARGDDLSASFLGAIDELAVYNRALGSNEIAAIYVAGSAGKCPPPAGIAPTITVPPQSQTVVAGSNVTFTATAAGTAPLSYQWRRNTTNLAGATGTSLTLSNVQPANAGTYSVRVTNAFGVATSSNAVLTVLLPSTNCAPRPSDLVSWWPAENNADDIVDGNHGTLQAVTFAVGKVGQAFEFNGTTSFISVPASANLNVGIGSGFAVEGWINPSTLALQRPIVEWNSGSGPNPYGAHFWISAVAGGGPGCLFANLVDTLGVEHFLTSAGGLLVTNSFQHVALTYDKSSGVARLYLNGIVVAQSNLGIFTPQTSYELSLGRRTVGFSQANHWAGKLDEISIYNRALGSNEIAAIYAAGSAGKCPPPAGIPPTIISPPESRTVNAGTNVTFFVTATGTAPLSYQWRRNETNLAGATGASLTLSNVQPANAGNYSVRVTNAVGVATSSNAVLTVVPLQPTCVAASTGLVSWWRGEGDALDEVGTNNGTFLGGASFAAGEVGQAFNFNGSGNHVLVPASAALDVGAAGGMTIEAWVNPADLVSSGPIVEWALNGAYAVHFYATWSLGPGRLYANLVSTTGTEYTIQTATSVLTSNAYQHVALSYDKASGVARLFRNGVIVRELTFGTFTPRTKSDLYIGYRPATSPAGPVSFHGQIDEVSVYSRALTVEEIQAIYNAGNAGKCAIGLAPFITAHPQSRTAIVGTNVTFTVTATGTAPLSYQWRRNDTNLAGATGTSLTLSNVQPANAATYSVRVSNAFGVVTSSNAVLTVAVAAYDVSANYSLVANPNGVWRYGALSNLAGPLTLLTFSRTFGADNAVPIGEWNPGGVLHPHINKVLGPGTAVSAGGAFVGPAGTVYFTPGEDGTAHNFGVIRFTVPAGGTGNYRIATAVQPLFDGALSADADFHVDKNGVQLFGVALGPNQGTSYSNTVSLAAGDTIDFAIGRGADGILGTTGLKIQATVAQVAGTSGGAFGLTSLVREPGTTAKLCFAGVSGNTYTVQASTNLIDWEVVGIAVADSNGVCEFEDRGSTKFPCRYYRIVVPH